MKTRGGQEEDDGEQLPHWILTGTSEEERLGGKERGNSEENQVCATLTYSFISTAERSAGELTRVQRSCDWVQTLTPLRGHGRFGGGLFRVTC